MIQLLATIPLGLSLWMTMILSVLALSCEVFPQESTIVSLDGAWKIYVGDSMEFAQKDFDDMGWETVVLPGSLMRHVLERGGPMSGIIWVRKHFVASNELVAHGAGISLGKISNADQTYVNGVLVGTTGEFPPKDIALWNQPRYYMVSPGIIAQGDTVIAIRIAYTLFGRVRGSLSVSDLRTWHVRQNLSFLLHVLNYAVMAVCGGIGLIFLLIYIRRPGWVEYRYFLLQLVPGFFVLYEVCGIIPLINDSMFRLKLLGIMWSALVVFHLGFLHRLYSLSRRGIEVLLWFLLLVNTALIIYGYDFYHHRWIAIFVILSLTPLALYNLSVHLTALRRGNAHARILIIPGGILSLGAAHDGIVYLGWALERDIAFLGYRFDELLFGYFAALMFIGAAFILVHRFMNAMDETEELNRSLEEKVGERTMELQKRVRELSTMVDAMHLDQRVKRSERGRTSLTQATEEKIRNAIVYIHENYMDDISREGLASLVGLNHDHFGKAFRIYTGKKLNDYINDLRVKNAAVMLRETERKIIDIAFDSGFESLRTFNRAFIRSFGITPNAYRKKGN